LVCDKIRISRRFAICWSRAKDHSTRRAVEDRASAHCESLAVPCWLTLLDCWAAHFIACRWTGSRHVTVDATLLAASRSESRHRPTPAPFTNHGRCEARHCQPCPTERDARALCFVSNAPPIFRPQREIQDPLICQSPLHQPQTAFEAIRGAACKRAHRLWMRVQIHYSKAQKACRSIMLKTTTITQLANGIMNGRVICSSLVEISIQAPFAPRLLRMLDSRARDA
jgi:hypothetical protein